MPHLIRSKEELDDLLPTPSPEDAAYFRELAGDLVILGAGGKIGPSPARWAGRAAQAAGAKMRIIGTARNPETLATDPLVKAGVEFRCGDLLDPSLFATQPDAPNVTSLAGRKFGSAGGERLTLAMNAYVPTLGAERYRHSRIVDFSSGNIYPFMSLVSGIATEATAPAPLGEHAGSVLARERMFEYFSTRHGTPVTLLRLNYAAERRYGVSLDIGARVFEGRSVDVTMGAANVLWQGDVNSVSLRCLGHCQSPPLILNTTGPETLSIRAVAERFGELFGKEPVVEGQEAPQASLNNAGLWHSMLGYPSVWSWRSRSAATSRQPSPDKTDSKHSKLSRQSINRPRVAGV